VNEENIIECELVPLPEYGGLESKKKKLGRYHKTNFWDIKGYGSKRWVVALRIAVQDQVCFQEMTDEEIFKGCFNFLNTPPPRKKYAKKSPQPKYGTLTFYKGNRLRRNNGIYLSALAIVNQKKSKHFWGKGKNVW
tara:strand:- start:202 stop:609 length:408 start_codon:yes stop_codon:yes gene_type:complete